MRSVVYIFFVLAGIVMLRPNTAYAGSSCPDLVWTQDSIIHIHPNPSNGPFEISGLDLWKGGTLKVFNSIGQEIGGIEISTVSLKIDLSGLPAGIYLMYLQIDGKKEVHRLVLK